ncbi:MAG TPA: bifunctional 2-C-methyl-D-erythritol 4-phosphate cytidylyltransferase/2-C-methyl-D-erythritol 2,4-cyclodiphosphate synthase [Alphaproteobacteria bacterium]|nr:bifunctional 2-C-methyl-D-erythritol 4-phosphate cytidylyltransferase/2-C-methyl-D-erythritol 2,4-cyclodiphosphate synthase [Alphaproteobacteria bacterium]HNS45018.1 bifunctional 2-C-methyl-D-erythritol 4-phosphate cytidylyltransferase/2-C-methyl-D-erythritol 2,4-cyclodiphosphate synthase [Alphaproteobacteria bacterium]
MSQNQPKNAEFSVIIVAAGTASRFGADIPKQYLSIGGKSVLSHTIAAFRTCKGLKHIQVVIHPDHLDLYHAATKDLNLPLPITGGKDRQESVYNALDFLNLDEDDIILVHDAARPCVRPEDIEHVVTALITHRAATLAAPISETIRRKADEILGETIDRDTLLSIQTPQGFYFGDLKSAHEKFKGQSFTDDTSLVAANGVTSSYVIGPKTNIKITTPEDLEMASYILSKANPAPIIKTGMGFDVHAFGDPAEHIRIGGIDIPYTHKLAGHSDADVALHAITDALYGTIADGDIGSHFPPSDPAHKGKDSTIFLQEALHSVTSQGGVVNHVDVTIICEAPKIGPHRDTMRERIASIMSLPLSRVAVKATTTEKLGFTGRGEGIAVQVVVTISIPE